MYKYMNETYDDLRVMDMFDTQNTFRYYSDNNLFRGNNDYSQTYQISTRANSKRDLLNLFTLSITICLVTYYGERNSSK